MKRVYAVLFSFLVSTFPLAGCMDKLAGYVDTYDIEIVFVDWQPNQSQERAIRQAAELWQGNILEGIPPSTLSWTQEEVDSNSLFFGCQPIDQEVDDLIIWITLDENISSLAMGKMCSYSDDYHTNTGSIRINPDTLLRNESSFRNIIAHEIGHSLIFSPRFWNIDYDDDGVLDREWVPGYDGTCYEGDAPRYYGPNGMAAWQDAGGTGGVPLQKYLENQNGPYSGCVHLDDDVFPEEINAAYSGGNEVFGLSNISIGMLDDVGYVVDYDNAIDTEINFSAVVPATN